MGLNSQISFWDGNHPYKIKNKIRLIELFAGIGAQAKALERLQAEGLCEFEHYRICEFDKYAVKSYNAVHGTDFQPSDITKIHADDLGIVDTDSFTYLLTYSFPCTDLSLAGRQEGMAKGSGTRSGLLWEVERLLNECEELPQVLLMENVPQVICPDFFLWIEFLESKGYKNYYKNINAKEMGVPQNRLRTFMVSLLGDYYYEFPEPIPLKKRLKDVLEDKVDEKYYLSDKTIDYFQKHSQEEKDKGNGFNFLPVEKDNAEIGKAVTTRAGSRMDDNFLLEKPNRLFNIYGEEMGGGFAGNVWDKKGLSPALMTMQGGNREPLILDEESDDINTIEISQTVKVRKYDVDIPKLKEVLKNHKKYSNKEISEKLNLPITKVEHWFRSDEYFCIPEAEIWFDLKALLNIDTDEFDDAVTVFEERENVFEKSNRVYLDNGVSPTVMTFDGVKILEDKEKTEPINFRIRKLTPKECWRLMDFDDEDFEKAQKVNSNAQLYKQAGNSIVVSCLYHIFKELL